MKYKWGESDLTTINGKLRKTAGQFMSEFTTYDFYKYVYWNLRGRWRGVLWDWIRRPACDATASISPETVIVETGETFVITIRIGKKKLEKNGRIAVYFPVYFGGYALRNSLQLFQGPDGDTGYGARIIAKTGNSGTSLKTIVHSTGSVFTCVEIISEGQLDEGNEIKLIIGDPSCKLPKASESAKHFPFRIGIDYNGDGEFLPVKPNPTLRTVGGQASHLRCFAPATPKPGQIFPVRVVASDRVNHNPSWNYSGKVSLSAVEGAINSRQETKIDKNSHGIKLIPGIAVNCSGVSRIQALDEANSLVGQTNPICPDAAPDGLSLFYGDIHSHSELSDGCGLPEDNYIWARDVEGLDFAAISDHPEWGQSYNYTQKEKWEIVKDLTERYNDPHKFVTLLGYEIGTLEQHKNVYFKDGTGKDIVEGRDGEMVTMNNVFQKLASSDYLLIPHASKFNGINWHQPHNPERQRLIEICSTWGISEEDGPCSVRYGLDLGYKFGFTGGTDNHKCEPGNPELGGITGVYAKSLTRDEIFEAFRARRTFATSGPRMIIRFDLNGAFMGSEIKLPGNTPRRLEARFITNDDISQIDIVRNGKVVHTVESGGQRESKIEWTDSENLESLVIKRELTDERFVYYYVRLKTVNNDWGWASPIWVHYESK